MERAHGKSAWKERRFQSPFPIAVSIRRFHSPLPIAVIATLNGDLDADSRVPYPPPLTWWNMSRDANDLLYGTLDLLVLKAIAAEPVHGFGITKWIEHRTKNELEIVDSALYKALHRLEDSGAIGAEWGVTENNRRAKYYSLTAR